MRVLTALPWPPQTFSVEESRTVRLLMRLLVLRALDSGVLLASDLGVDDAARPQFAGARWCSAAVSGCAEVTQCCGAGRGRAAVQQYGSDARSLVAILRKHCEAGSLE